MMKVVAFNGSPRRDGNTATLINTVFDELHKEGIETEFVQVGGKDIKGCREIEVTDKKDSLHL